MVLHWIACLWYYISSMNDDWKLAKDLAFEVTIIYEEENWVLAYS